MSNVKNQATQTESNTANCFIYFILRRHDIPQSSLLKNKPVGVCVEMPVCVCVCVGVGEQLQL